ncbi:MAG: hypothetical protein ACRBB5_04145, partial [Nitrosopumilus sp.]
MNNEIGRKITSLTIMTIMIAGGMTFAVPGVMPAAHAANANLFVSAENSNFDNYMSGPQVIEVVVIDTNINDTNEAKGEPDVTVNGKNLRMIQAVDGNWYGYFADRNMAQIADSTSQVVGEGLDFGVFCASDVDLGDTATGESVTVTDTVGVALPRAASVTGGVDGDANGGPLTNTCTPVLDQFADADIQNVLREEKDLNTAQPTDGDNTVGGQIGIDSAFWPFIQLYPLNPTGNVDVQYNRGGGAQTTVLTFDTVDNFASSALDRTVYPPGSEIHATITDLWLNIDPTDEDSWTFGTVGTLSTNYQVFDENGGSPGDTATNTASGTGTLTSRLADLMCEDNCVLAFNPDVENKGIVASLQDNDDSAIVSTGDPDDPITFETAAGNLAGNAPITITEQGPNSGVFGTQDESDTSVLRIVNDALRGTSASIDYNEDAVTILVGLSFGSVDIIPIDSEWSSGEEIPVELVDNDANTNSRADEDLDLNNPNVALIPSLQTGSPATLNGLSAASLGEAITVDDDVVQSFSERAMLEATSVSLSDGSSLDLTFGTMKDFFDAAPVNDNAFNGFALFNYDIRSLSDNVSGIDSFDIVVSGVTIATDVNDQGLLLIDEADTDALAALGSDVDLDVSFIINDVTGTPVTGLSADATLPVVADVFGFGFLNDGLEGGERIANQIIRLELEETGDNTGIFEGSLEYTMINQLNILDSDTYEGLSTIADDPSFIVIEDLTDEDSPRVNYFDLGADGVSTQIADQEEAPSHSGIVSFDLDTYKTADTVVITLQDSDLNVDSDLIDIYTTVSGSATDLNDIVGSDANSFRLSDGDELGRVLDVTFDDQLWTAANDDACTALLTADGIDTGLAATGFTLIETEKDSGSFIGDFQIPAKWCRAGESSPESATGLDIEVNYVDFRDASGEVIEVGDSAGIRANTGSISLDRTVYPVPFGVPDNFGDLSGDISPDNRSIFAIHATGVNDDLTVPGSFLPGGDLSIHVRVNDPDFDVSASGEDKIAQNTADLPVGPVEISVIRGSETVILGYAGGPNTIDGTINVGTDLVGNGEVDSISELSDISTNTGFTDGTITIEQTGATDATATFTNSGTGEVDATELEITNSDSGFSSGVVTITQGDSTATATFNDLNGDTNVEEGELEITSSDATFTDGIVTITSGALIATATFADDVNSIDAGEITAITGAGVDFVTGTVILTQGDASASATFTDIPTITQFGPIDEIAPDAGIFEVDVAIQYTDGPADARCPTTVDFDASTSAVDGELTRFSATSPSDENYCILQGDILQVEYTDPADASGDENTVTDSATFDLRNGVLQSDKSVYIIGSDMILTLI